MKSFLQIVLVASVLLTSGCVSWLTPEFETTALSTAKSKEAKSITYNLRRTSRCSIDGEFSKIDVDSIMTGAWAAPQTKGTTFVQFRDIFSSRTSHMGQSTGGTFTTDLFMDVNMQNGWNGLALFGSAISGFTWGIIPCWGDDRYTLYVEVESKTGLKKSYQLKGVVGTFSWLPCLLAMPFSSTPSRNVDELTSAEWRELLIRMENDGFFDKP